MGNYRKTVFSGYNQETTHINLYWVGKHKNLTKSGQTNLTMEWQRDHEDPPVTTSYCQLMASGKE